MKTVNQQIQPLVIPFDNGQYAVIPLGISINDFRCLEKTLALWKKRIVHKEILEQPLRAKLPSSPREE